MWHYFVSDRAAQALWTITEMAGRPVQLALQVAVEAAKGLDEIRPWAKESAAGLMAAVEAMGAAVAEDLFTWAFVDEDLETLLSHEDEAWRPMPF